MLQVGKILEQGLSDRYKQEIEHSVKEGSCTDALEQLFDFARDFAPSLSNDVIVLHGRYSTLRRQARTLNKAIGDVDPAPIFAAVLELCTEIHKSAHVATDLRIPIEQKLEELPESLARRVAEIASTPSQRSSSSLNAIRNVYIEAWREATRDAHEALLVRARNLTKSYGGDAFRLQSVSLDLIAGEITGVVGMNASGKTTLLRLLLGEIKHDGGELTYPGISPSGNDWLKIKSDLAYVPQLPNRWYGRLRNNLNHVAAAYGVTGNDNKRMVDTYVRRYGLEDYENATWDRISGGYKIRFELVRALLSQPRVLIIDEPLAYLDIVTQQIFLADIRTIASSLERPIAVIGTSQHLFEIESIADRMIILDDGKPIYSGRMAEL